MKIKMVPDHEPHGDLIQAQQSARAFMGTGTVASDSLMTGWSIDRNKRSR